MEQGILVLDSNGMPEKYKAFLDIIKSKALKGKIVDNHGHLELLSPQATSDTDYWEGYQIFIIDTAEVKK